MAEGTRLVYATVAFYQGLKAGEIGEVPAEIAETAIAGGYAMSVDSLEARLKVTRGPRAESAETDIPAEILARRQAIDVPPRRQPT